MMPTWRDSKAMAHQLLLFDSDGPVPPPAGIRRGSPIAWRSARGPASGCVVGVHELGVAARREGVTTGRTHLLPHGAYWRFKHE